MEKTFNLDSKESLQLAQLEQERTQALATYGALALDMEQARKNLDGVAERQRAFLRHAVVARGIDRYDNARMQNGAITVTVPDPPQASPVAEVMPRLVERPNGSIIEAKD